MEDPRPEYCCGNCPPIVGGGYDCTCKGNPRCEKGRYLTRRYKVTFGDTYYSTIKVFVDAVDRQAAVKAALVAILDTHRDELYEEWETVDPTLVNVVEVD